MVGRVHWALGEGSQLGCCCCCERPDEIPPREFQRRPRPARFTDPHWPWRGDAVALADQEMLVVAVFILRRHDMFEAREIRTLVWECLDHWWAVTIPARRRMFAAPIVAGSGRGGGAPGPGTYGWVGRRARELTPPEGWVGRNGSRHVYAFHSYPADGLRLRTSREQDTNEGHTLTR